MLQTVDRSEARFNALRGISRALARPLDLVEMLRSVSAELGRVLDAPICFFGLYDAVGQSVNVIWQVHEGVELPGGTFPLGNGFTSQVIRNGEPLLIRDWSRQGPPVQVQYATDRPVLPQSCITVPAIYDERVLGVLSIQSYQSEVFDHNDVALVQAVADQLAAGLGATGQARSTPDKTQARTSELETIVASMSDALLLVDKDARVMRLNRAARTLLCLGEGSVLLGWPADEPQKNYWPLGNQSVTDAVRPILRAVKRGEAPPPEVTFAVPPRSVRCTGSLLLDEGVPRGGVLTFREILPRATPN